MKYNCAYAVIEENAYYRYPSIRYFMNIVDAYDLYKLLKRDIDNVYLIEFKIIEK